jgi:hypothetical protein
MDLNRRLRLEKVKYVLGFLLCLLLWTWTALDADDEEEYDETPAVEECQDCSKNPTSVRV